MVGLAEFFATFWGKVSLVAGGLFGIAVIAFIVNATVAYYRNKILKKILETEKKNNTLLKQIKQELKIKK